MNVLTTLRIVSSVYYSLPRFVTLRDPRKRSRGYRKRERKNYVTYTNFSNSKPPIRKLKRTESYVTYRLPRFVTTTILESDRVDFRSEGIGSIKTKIDQYITIE